MFMENTFAVGLLLPPAPLVNVALACGVGWLIGWFNVLNGSLEDVDGDAVLPKRLLVVAFAEALPNKPFVAAGWLVASEVSFGPAGALRFAKGLGFDGGWGVVS